ncbi:protein FAM83G-like isoform X1 [Entelurus aequoreus]|uniref:protein FAM83G-like isoform X1 n=1 Tax=Entelurus aequoreus TaxID=161455 RepID=UPI002B1CE4D4|nr:protein FAM83G-like isoform X1 [Entelurus aequoreus]
MALSQIQCLDDNHVNLRTNESKPDFLYGEDQRLALETLLQEGRQSLAKFLQDRQMRSFLSDLELDALTAAQEPYNPGVDLYPEGAEEDEPPLSLHYWPDLSDMSIPQMDLGWPHSEGYRGVTRTYVHTQPPMEGDTHIKEIVRRMIAQAQKVIAVVMDLFTDVDIFQDLIDAGYKRKVSIYILLESTTLPHFLSMCQRANMHAGHLKHLRVRCTEGSEFNTRSCSKVKGRLGHRFMFIDGDKAVSGSFSFTWMSSRLDTNLVTVITGQAVEAFDHLFLNLYMSSRFVDLRQVTTNPEPEADPLPQPVTVTLPSTTIARKLYNPKYALLVGENASPSPSAVQNSPKESQTPDVPDTKKRRRGKGSQEPGEVEEFIHPGLINLEKACLINYLPTWPEPDPPKDVIGFINIMDTSKPTQVHLQRSERFETSQAIRFSSPFSNDILPVVAKQREASLKTEEKTNPASSQNIIKAEQPGYDTVQFRDPTSTKAEKLQVLSSALTRQDDGQPTKHTASQFSNVERTKQTNTDSSNTEYRAHAMESNKTQAPQLKSSVDLNSGTKHPQTKKAMPLMQTVHTQQDRTSESFTSLSVNNPAPTTDASLSAKSTSSTRSALTSRFETVQHLLSLSSSSTPTTLTPHTAHSVTKAGDTSDGPVMSNTGTSKMPDSLTTTKAAGPKSTGEHRQRTPVMLKNNNKETGVQKFDRNKKDKEAVGLHDGKRGTPCVSANTKKSQSEATFAPTKDGTSDELNSVDDGSAKPQADHAATVETKTRATAKPITRSKSANIENEKNADKKTYQVRENKPQRISYSEKPSLSMWERIQAQTLDTSSKDVKSTKLHDNTTHSKKNAREASQDSAKKKELSHAAEKSPNLHLPDVRSSERKSWSTPDSPAKTPDLQTSTSDMSDGYLSSRDDSNRSTTSEEYQECSASPNHERMFEKALHQIPGTTDTHTDKSQANTPSVDNPSLLFKDYSSVVALFGTKDKHVPKNETQALDKKVKKLDKEEVRNKDSGIQKMDEKGRTFRSERDSKGKDRRNGEESKTTGSPKTAEKAKETQAQTPIRKRALNMSATGTPVHKDKNSEVKTEKAGPSNVQNRDGLARQVDGQKQPKATAKPSRLVSTPVAQEEKKVSHSSSQVFDYLSSFHKASSEQPPS